MANSFTSLILITLFILVVSHLSIKVLLREKVFRHSVKLGGLLKENYTNVNTAKSELLDFLKVNLKDIEANIMNRVKGSNYYGKFHDSDLHHEETDLSKYFDVEQSVPATEALLKEVQCARAGKSPLYDNLTGSQIQYELGSDDSPIAKPDHWFYKNEKPMNGGDLDGIKPFDDLQSNFTLYNTGNVVGGPGPHSVSTGGGVSDTCANIPPNTPKNFGSAYPYVESAGLF